jgi:hypothetical protein
LFVAHFHYLVVEATCVKTYCGLSYIVIQNIVLTYSTNIFNLLIMNATPHYQCFYFQLCDVAEVAIIHKLI